MTRDSTVLIDKIEARAYTVPTDYPEADGTVAWDSTTMVLVKVHGGGKMGLGYTYAHQAAATLIQSKLAGLVHGKNAFDIPSIWKSLVDAERNFGYPGLGSMATAAIDTALWDFKARLLDASFIDLWGAAREGTLVYGSGGFTSYPIERLKNQLAGWVEQGIPWVKIKVGSQPDSDPARVKAARAAIGPGVGLMVDGNGAYQHKQALALANAFAEFDVMWFEEPVSSDDLAGLRLMRDRGPPGMAITAGEYGWDVRYFRAMLEAQAVDVLQVDATRCGGFTGFMQAAALCEGFGIPLSAHTAPNLHAHVCAALSCTQHIEYFYDHARIEDLFFDGALTPQDGMLKPDRARPGHGLEFREADADQYAV